MYLSASHHYEIKNRDVLNVIVYMSMDLLRTKNIHGSAVTH